MKILLLGDSITQGLGSKKINFTKELSQLRPNDYILNEALTGTTIAYPYEEDAIIFNNEPDVVVILYGNVDAQLKPRRDGLIFKHLPKRYAASAGNMLLPRPFYSKSFFKSIGQHLDNLFRTIFRNLIFIIDGTEQWVSLENFSRMYYSLCKKMTEKEIKVICCSTVAIDDKLFPGSSEEYTKYNQSIKNIADELNCKYLDLYTKFQSCIKSDRNGWNRYYNKDHFHPNGEGYLLMAKWIDYEIKNM